jgi:hypothetical protein
MVYGEFPLSCRWLFVSTAQKKTTHTHTQTNKQTNIQTSKQTKQNKTKFPMATIPTKSLGNSRPNTSLNNGGILRSGVFCAVRAVFYAVHDKIIHAEQMGQVSQS